MTTATETTTARIRGNPFLIMREIVMDLITASATRAALIEPKLLDTVAEARDTAARLFAVQPTPQQVETSACALATCIAAHDLTEYLLTQKPFNCVRQGQIALIEQIVTSINNSIARAQTPEDAASMRDPGVLTASVLRYACLAAVPAPADMLTPEVAKAHAARLSKIMTVFQYAFPADWLRAMLAMSNSLVEILPLTDSEYNDMVLANQEHSRMMLIEIEQVERDTAKELRTMADEATNG